MNSASLEKIVVASIINGDSPAVLQNIRPDYFTDPLLSKLVRDMQAYSSTDRRLLESKGIPNLDYALEASMNAVPTDSPKFRSYTDDLRKEYVRAEKIKVYSSAQMVLSGNDPDWKNKSEQLDYKLSKLNLQHSGLESRLFRVQDYQDDVLSNVLKRSQSTKAYTGVPSGYPMLDEMTSGFQSTDLIVVAARPGVGKSSLITSIVENLSLLEPDSVIVVFSLEMSKEQILQRLISSIARVPLIKLRNGLLELREWARILYARNYISQFKLYINDTPAITPSYVRSLIHEARSTAGRVDIVFVDYLQLMSPDSVTGHRVSDVTQLSGAAKAIAKEEKLPVVMLSQLSRAPETRTDSRPKQSDLRESGAIEQDADVIIFLYRDELYNPTPENAAVAEFIISKQRNGPTGTVLVGYINFFTRFESII